MNEYISRKSAIGILKAMSENADCGCAARMFDRVKKRLEAMPAADVEPVVRCGSCRHYSPDIAYCGIHSHFVTRNGDFCYPDESSEWKTFSQEDYCSQGERKNDADEPDGA